MIEIEPVSVRDSCWFDSLDNMYLPHNGLELS